MKINWNPLVYVLNTWGTRFRLELPNIYIILFMGA